MSRIKKATIATYGQACTINNGCDSSKGLSCSVYNQTLYVCLCDSLYYWSGVTCTAQKMGSPVTACSSQEQCRSGFTLCFFSRKKKSF